VRPDRDRSPDADVLGPGLPRSSRFLQRADTRDPDLGVRGLAGAPRRMREGRTGGARQAARHAHAARCRRDGAALTDHEVITRRISMTTIEWLLAALLGSTALTSIPAQEHGRPTDKPAVGTAAKPATVFVVARSHGRYEVMTKEALKARNKQISDDYARAVHEHAKEKAAAKRAHKKATGADPRKAPLLE